jgi:hypothetical protein
MNPFRKRLRGHCLDKLEALERALTTFVGGTNKSKEIQHFTRDEERDLQAFQIITQRISKMMRSKLIALYEGADLSAAQQKRLPESIKERLRID